MQGETTKMIESSAVKAECDSDTLSAVTVASSSVLPSHDKSPPVIILNIFHSGLGIARDLHGRGMRVVGLSAHREAFGNFTRLCEVRKAPNSEEQPEQLAEFLLQAADELQGAVIFPTRDFDVLFLDRFRNELTPHYRLSIPDGACLQRAMNKDALVMAARKVGVPVPRTLVVRSADELARVPAAVGFPCVVKPVSSADWRRHGRWEKIGCRKAFLVQTMEELREEYAAVSAVAPEILAQEWIPGAADQIVVLGGYVNEDAEPLAYFTARKLVQSPDDFGTGCVVQSEEIPEILEPTIRLWRALGYHGMAEVEYKLDPRTGEYMLIEMNTRHWDWHQLGLASGINLSWVAYRHLIGEPVAPSCARIVHAKWIAEDSLLFYILRGLRRGEIRLRTLWKQLSGPRIYGIFSWNDPRPLVCYGFAEVLSTISKQFLNRIRGGKRLR